MKIFRSYTFTWWQIGIFKLALLMIGISIGSYWFAFFGPNLVIWITIAVVASLYIMWAAFRQ
jgi:hypothetical protein